MLGIFLSGGVWGAKFDLIMYKNLKGFTEDYQLIVILGKRIYETLKCLMSSK